MQCPNCAFENIPGLARCARCQTVLDLEEVSVEPPRRKGRRIRVAARWRWWMKETAARVSHTIDRFLSAAFRPNVPAGRFRLRWLIIPGLAQRAMRQPVWGKIFFWGWLLCLGGAVLMIGTWWAPTLAMLAVSLHASSVASMWYHRRARSQSVFQALWRGLVAFVLLAVLVYRPLAWLGGRFLRVVPVAATSGPSSALHSGDALVVTGPWLTDPPARGELVLYWLQSRGGPGWQVNGGQNIDRIMGLPGDHVAYNADADVLTVNALLPPPNEMPLAELKGFPSFAVEAKPGQYIVIPSVASVQHHGENVEFTPQMARAASVIEAQAVQGRPVYRLRPLGRLGPLE